MVAASEIRDIVDDRSDLKSAVKAVLESDPPFTFDDVEIDSGSFGELVSRGIIVRTDEGFVIADRKAVRQGLSGTSSNERSRRELDFSLPQLNQTELALLVCLLTFVVAVRLTPLPNVYYKGHIVLSSNDPYFYRYWVESLLSNPDITLSSLPRGVTQGEPLFISTLWFISLTFGGSLQTAGHVMAWYPVVSALITAMLVYLIAYLLSDDPRIGFAAVAMLAVIPGHAFRTSLGFADHHAFDYPWLVLTLLGIVILSSLDDPRSKTVSVKTFFAVIAISLGVAAQTLAWDNGPLLLIPIGVFIVVDGLRAVHQETSPLRTGGPVVAGVAVGAIVTWSVHVTFGWHTDLVAAAPLILKFGCIGVVAIGTIVNRLGLDELHLLVIDIVGLVTGIISLQSLRPEFWNQFTTRLESILLARRAIVETSGLFGESLGWLLLLGFALFIGVPYLAWGTYNARQTGRWVAPVCYGWYFIGLAAIQVRFVGELAPIIAVFAGFGFVHLVSVVDLGREPTPFADNRINSIGLPKSRELMQLALIFLLIFGFGIVQTPIQINKVIISEPQADAAIWMAEDSADRKLTYPDNYVFSEWGRNRFYNYFVSGQSLSYGYARSNYGSFVLTTEPEVWYNRLRNHRGYIVTTPDVVQNSENIGKQLHRYNGAGSARSMALAHYRLVHVTGEGAYKIFQVVPGAILSGTAHPNSTVVARTRVDLTELSFEYERRTTSSPNGSYKIRVSQPGHYDVWNTSVSVSQKSVHSGSVVSVES